jgi:spermidine synthase
MILLVILVCFFVSGITGLAYQVLWTRMIVEIIGTSPFSVSIVLTVFMAGLGFGSYLAGKMIDRITKPEKLIRIYGFLELGIGLYCLVLPLLLMAFKPVYSFLYNGLFQHFFVYNLLTFIGCAILLIAPVTCMGATLPVLSRFFVTTLSRVGTHIGRLYALNTIGAAVGSLLCGFWLIDALGVWGVLTLAIVLNAAVGALCVIVSVKHADRIVAPEFRDLPLKPSTLSKRKLQKSETAVSFSGPALIIFAISGFCAMAYEVLWTKLLGLLVGPTTYSFTVVLVTFITGLALGSLFFGWLGDRVRNTVALLVGTQIAAALSALLFSQVIGNSQIFFAKLIFEFQDSFAHLYLMQGLLLFGFMFLTTFCLGASFPLVGRIYTRSLATAGRSIGYAYAINSIGAVLGSFIAGFVLIPFLGKENSIRLVVCLQLLAAFALWFRAASRLNTSMIRRALVGIPAMVGIALMLYFPRWDHAMLSVGKYHRFDMPEIKNVGWMRALFSWDDFLPDLKSAKLLFYGDGIGGFTTVLELTDLMGEDAYSLCNSGKPDASSTRDMDTQTILAHFAMLFHPAAEDSLVIGLGSGITAGEILHYPVKRLDIVEINEKVVEASNFFIPWNNHVLADPRTRLILQDGRAHLELSDRKYDVITSEPTNPWMAGIAALYTKDFFDSAAAKLKPNGMFVQWIPAYQMSQDAFMMIGRTFAAAFPKSVMVSTNPARPSSFLLVGMNGKGDLDLEAAKRNLQYARKSTNIVLRNSQVLYNLIVSDDLKTLFGEGPLNTDNRPLLEYMAPKTMHKTDTAIIRTIGTSIDLSLSRKLAAIQKENLAGVDAQIDRAEYFLGFRGYDNSMLQYQVNLTAATPEQKARYFRIMEDFCARNLITEFWLIQDPELRERCFLRQHDALVQRLRSGKNLPELYSQLGGICMQNQRPEKAIEYFSQRVALQPGNATALNDLGAAYMASQDYDKAQKQFTEALRINPDDAPTHGRLGILLASQGKEHLEEAIVHYRIALRLNPTDADTCNNLGSALMAQGKLEEASAYFMSSLQLRPGFQKAQNNMQKLMLLQQQGITAPR